MLVIISPAKTLDMAPAPAKLASSQPSMAAQADPLIADLRKLKAGGIKKMMGVSDAIAGLNAKRFSDFVLSDSLPAEGAKQAALAFDGPVRPAQALRLPATSTCIALNADRPFPPRLLLTSL
jgi:cytoplasmic iron level regulating protein YaaA (DUF328/UPF0246 family)